MLNPPVKVKQIKMKICKFCLKEFDRWFTLNTCCSPRCNAKYLQAKDKEKRKVKREKKLVSVTVLKSKLWKIISEYIRRKYADSEGIASCVTCGESKHWKELQAGHFCPSWASSYLRYTETNIHPQCYHCNINLWSNPIEYRIYMVKTYGEKFVEQMLELRNEPINLKTFDLQILIGDYQDKLYTLPPE